MHSRNADLLDLCDLNSNAGLQFCINCSMSEECVHFKKSSRANKLS